MRIVFYLLLILVFGGCRQPLKKQPNVIIILTDDQGYGDIGIHGNENLYTHHLDQLFKESVRLTDFHVNPTCSPSRAALLTGKNANRVGVWHTIAGRSILYEDEVIMPQIFKENGYRTGIFGKWHLGDNYPYRPQDRGFDEVLIHKGGGVGQQPDYWDNDYFDDTYFHNGEPQKYSGYCTDVWFDNAIDFIRNSQKSNSPFFCYLSTNAPHSPYYVGSEYASRYIDKQNVANPAFNGMIGNIDENIGKLMQFLRDQEIENNTIVIFMTDNGTSAGIEIKEGVSVGYNANMRGKKGSEYEGGHRVPFFIRWPDGGLQHGSDVSMLAAHTDVFPTLIDLAELNVSSKIVFDGISLAKWLKVGNEVNDTTRVLITDSQRIEKPEEWKNSCTMQGEWRLINGKELYNIGLDPAQERDVANTYPEMVKQLRVHYKNWWNSLESSFAKTAHIPLATPYERQTVLHTHDAHLDNDSDYPAWNQLLVRQDERNVGYYTIEVPQDGLYTFSLRRWPMETAVGINNAVAEKQAVANTTVTLFQGGKNAKVNKASIQVGDQKWIQNVSDDAEFVSFEVKLVAGKTTLSTWFQEGEESPFAANYTYVNRK